MTLARNAVRHILTAVAVLAVGPIAGAIAGDMRLPGGATGATAFTSESAGHGGALLLIALLIVGATGTLISRLCGVRHGLLCAGLVAAWVAWRQGTVEGVLLNARSGVPLRALALEGILVGAAVVAIAWAVSAVNRESNRPRHDSQRPPLDIGAVFTVALAATGAVIGGSLFAVEGIKGQAMFAAFIGAVLAGAAARLVQPETPGERDDTPPIGAFIAIALLAFAAPIAAMWVHGAGVAEAAFGGRLLRVAYPGPVDWMAGALLGVPIGSAWAQAMIYPTAASPAS